MWVCSPSQGIALYFHWSVRLSLNMNTEFYWKNPYKQPALPSKGLKHFTKKIKKFDPNWALQWFCKAVCLSDIYFPSYKLIASISLCRMNKKWKEWSLPLNGNNSLELEYLNILSCILARSNCNMLAGEIWNNWVFYSIAF